MTWWEVRVSEFFFEHTATVLIAQGMPLENFFMRCQFTGFDKRGQFILLKGALSSPASPPLRLTDVVLAHVTALPEGMTKPALLSHLLLAVQ